MNMSSVVNFASMAGSATVGSVIGQVQDALTDVINLAFDRFDRSMLIAAERMQVLVDTLAKDLEGLMDATINELDEERRKMVDDLATLARQADDLAEGRLDQMEDITTAMISTIQELLTDAPGYLDIYPAVATHGDSVARFEIHGVNVNRLDLDDMRLGGLTVKPSIEHQDGDDMAFTVPLAGLNLPAPDETDDVISLALTFSVADDSWWPWSKKKGRPFTAALHIYPKVAATVTAVWSGEVTERETKTLSRSQSYPRLKSRSLGGRRKATRNHEERPPEGWLFDFNNAQLQVQSSDGCNNRASKGVWRVRQSKIVSADVYQVTESGPSIGCYVSSTITVPMYKTTDVDRSFTSEPAPIAIGQKIALSPPDAAKGAKDLKLSHVEISSPVFATTDTTLVLPGEAFGGMKLEVDQSSNTAFVSVNFA